MGKQCFQTVSVFVMTCGFSFLSFFFFLAVVPYVLMLKNIRSALQAPLLALLFEGHVLSHYNFIHVILSRGM